MSRNDVVIRGTNKSGLVLILPEELEFTELCDKIWARLSQAGKFFKGTEVTVQIGGCKLTVAERELIGSILAQFEMTLKGFDAGVDPVVSAALAAQAAQANPPPRAAAESVRKSGGLPAAALLQESETALVVTRTLRSGQSVKHQGDVIILGDVNPGAEIVATGHIVVMGALRGVAHAGAGGNAAAFVAATKLRPTQLRIGQVIGRAPDEAEDLKVVPEVARVRNGVIVVETPAETKR